MKRFLPLLVFCLSAFLSGCADNKTSEIQSEVELLVGEPGILADRAQQALVSRGAMVIPILETGLYIGNAQGRKKVIRVLSRIGDASGLPIIKFVASHDKESQVRDYANQVLENWDLQKN